MQRLNPVSFVKFIAKQPTRVKELIHKISERFFDRKDSLSQIKHNEWLDDKLVDFESFASQIDFRLWAEAKEFAEELSSYAKERLTDIPYHLG